MVSPQPNVPISQGAVTVASVADDRNVQHQEVTLEYLDANGAPRNVGLSAPLPVQSSALEELLMAILVELRINNELSLIAVAPEAEPIELLRAKYQSLPITL
jgi:hypothetical protein